MGLSTDFTNFALLLYRADGQPVFDEKGVGWSVFGSDPRQNTCHLMRFGADRKAVFRKNVSWWDLKLTHGTQFNNDGEAVYV